MPKQLKEILLNIAQLSMTSQRWILRRLTAEQMAVLNQHQGMKFLDEAKSYRRLKNNKLNLLTSSKPSASIPPYCQELAIKSPLYAAIVLDQGTYPWEELFLKQFDAHGLMKQALETKVPDLKPLIKNALFHEWELSLSFESYLEEQHG